MPMDGLETTNLYILHARYYDKPKLFNQSIQNFLEEINQNYQPQLSKLLNA